MEIGRNAKAALSTMSSSGTIWFSGGAIGPMHCGQPIGRRSLHSSTRIGFQKRDST